MCNFCRAYIIGKLYDCTACPDIDLCASFMERYEEGGFADCVGHEFLCIPTDDWKREDCTNVYSQEFVDWLKEIALKHKPKDEDFELPILGLGDQYSTPKPVEQT
ncbi:hypothetical protein BDV06DRAFT_226487 [Aspergillus oleicola]